MSQKKTRVVVARPGLDGQERRAQIIARAVGDAGTMAADEIPGLKAIGVAQVFVPGASTTAAIEFIRGAVAHGA